jgi:hypothetical protein
MYTITSAQVETMVEIACQREYREFDRHLCRRLMENLSFPQLRNAIDPKSRELKDIIRAMPSSAPEMCCDVGSS